MLDPPLVYLLLSQWSTLLLLLHHGCLRECDFPALSLSLLLFLLSLLILNLNNVLNVKDRVVSHEIRDHILKNLLILIQQAVSESAVIYYLNNLVNELELILLQLITSQPLGSHVLLNHHNCLLHELSIVLNHVFTSKDPVLIHLQQLLPNIS